MSRENVEIVRMPIRVLERRRRTLDQRLALRFPWLTAANARLIAKLAPKNGLVTRLQEYYDHAEALEAVGLSE